MSSLRIAILAGSDNPLAEPFAGGLESHTFRLCRELIRRGHQVVLYAPPDTDPTLATELITFPELALSTVAAADRTLPARYHLQAHHGYVRAVADILRRKDIELVHNASLHYLPLVASALLPPMLTGLHTPPFSWLESAAQAAERVDFVAVSNFLAGQWTSLRHRPAVIGNGVDPAGFPPGPGGDRLVWGGRITPEKGTHLAVQAARLAEQPLRLAGPIGDHQYFTAAVEPLLGKDIEYLGHLNEADTGKLFGESSAMLFTSTWAEPFGQVVVEAMMTGTPVAAFAVGGVPELITDGRTGRLLPPSDVTAMAASIADVLELDRSAVTTAARQRFSLSTMVDQYVARYRQLVA